MTRRTRTITATAVATTLLAAGTACSTPTEPASAPVALQPTSDITIPSRTRPTHAADAADPNAEVEQVMLTSQDVGNAAVRLIEGGDQVRDQVTLDGCGFDFTSESLRVARRQVVVAAEATADAFYSNEVVAYRTKAAARLAMSQFEESVQTCSDDYTRSKAATAPPTRAVLVKGLADPSTLPVTPSLLTLQQLTTEAGGSFYLLVTFQVHGDVLNGNYLITKTSPSQAQVDTLLHQATVTGNRLAGLAG